jgi:N-acetylneuraminic acid mutarotase
VASGGEYNGYDELGSCEMFNTDTCTWSNIATLNIPRYDHAAAVHNFFVYVFGGQSNKYIPRAEIEQYDADANKWTLLKARLSQPRFWLAAASVDSRILILGGAVYQKEDKKQKQLDVIDCFDAEKQECQPRSKLPKASYDLLAASYSESLNDEL